MSNSRLVTGACIDGYALCIDCAHMCHSDEELLTEWSPIYAGSEWDISPACDMCQCEIECSVIEVDTFDIIDDNGEPVTVVMRWR